MGVELNLHLKDEQLVHEKKKYFVFGDIAVFPLYLKQNQNYLCCVYCFGH